MTWTDSNQVIDRIKEEAHNRPIVPFLGAGISIAAGFPTIRFVVQYLAKVEFAIRLGVFQHRFPELDDRQTPADTYRQHPSKFLEDFGWPDLCQLDADLWMWLCRGQYSNSKDYGGEGRRKIYNDSYSRYKRCVAGENLILDLLSNDLTRTTITKGPPHKIKPLDLRDHIAAIVQWTLRHDLADRESGTSRATLREWRRWKKWYHEGYGTRAPDLLYGDWEALLDRLCEGSFDLTDVLFTSFEQGRTPTLSHRYLAFLQQKLGIPLILTTNFDSLLERALREEGCGAKIFDVHRDAELPDAALVKRQFSILKLHGSAYGLRLGERLKYPLDAEARRDALHYIPHDALILVMGFSGSERRIMQLLQAVVRERQLGKSSPRLIWIQGPNSPGPLFHDLADDLSDQVLSCQIRNIDTFLQELYFRFAGSYQSSTKGYSTLPPRPQPKNIRPLVPRVPTIDQVDKPFEQSKIAMEREEFRRPVQLFIAQSRLEQPRATSWASLAAGAFVTGLDYGYNIIWIDLENHHTVEGVVAEIFDKVRLTDPQAPSCIITDLHSSDTAINKAVDRIREVFQRGRHVLVFDSVESFGRPQMMHHGIPSYDMFRLSADPVYRNRLIALEGEFSTRVANLALFLRLLLNLSQETTDRFETDQAFWDSYVLISVDEPRLRYRSANRTGEPPTFLTVKEKLVQPLRDIATAQITHVHAHLQPTPGYESLFDSSCDWRPKRPDPSHGLSEQWRSAGINPQPSGFRSLRRARDVVRLLHDLRRLPEQPQGQLPGGRRYQFAKDTSSAFVGLLSVFRRPRSIPMLRSIVERWALQPIAKRNHVVMSRLAHEAVDCLLRTISSEAEDGIGAVAQIHEGGVVWLYREVHESAYDALTELLHTRDWIAAWHGGGFKAEPKSACRADAVIDGMLSVTWHLFAARTYYADVFLPTRDIRAFYEYLYHRVAAIRSITLLMAIIETADGHQLWVDINDALAKVKDETRSAYPNDLIEDYVKIPICWYSEVLGFFAAITADNGCDLASFQRNLIELRRHALETLLMAIRRNRLYLRAVATPDTVLAWSHQFLERELDDIRGDVLKICGNIESQMTVESLLAKVSPTSTDAEAIKELENVFDDFRFQARLSKLDFEGAYLECLKEPGNGIASSAKPEEMIGRLARSVVMVNDPKLNTMEVREEFKQSSSLLLRVAKCLANLRDHGADQVTAKVIECSRELYQHPDAALRMWAKKQRRNALELRCKWRLGQWIFWQTLLDRQRSEGRREDVNLLKAEEESVEYEDMLRETSDTNEDDYRHRSSALALRARSLYLRRRYRQAHHFLDLGSAGLIEERLDHRTPLAIIHLLRAELLAISADEHYQSETDQIADESSRSTQRSSSKSLSDVMIALVAGALKKIGRAEVELSHAERNLLGMAHQIVWSICLDFGWAQLKLERILFEIEELFWSNDRISSTVYLQRSGALEQMILDGMRRLRSVLDMIPYRDCKWENVVGCFTERSTILQTEKMVYKLWRQFFIAGAYYSGVLSYRYSQRDVEEKFAGGMREARHLIPQITGISVTGAMSKSYLDRWKLWCSAMRFEHFGENVQLEITLTPERVHKGDNVKAEVVSMRSVVTDIMESDCSPSRIEKMWDTRREKGKSGRDRHRKSKDQ